MNILSAFRGTSSHRGASFLRATSFFRGWACSGIVAVLLMLSSCQPSLYYTSYHDFSHSQWDNRDTVTFSLPPSDHDLDTRFTIGLRTLPPFHYQDVTVRLQLLDDDSHPLASFSVPIALYDGDTPKGKGVAIIDHFSAPQSFTLKAHQHYTVRLTHLMRLNPLEGIPSVGILVEP